MELRWLVKEWTEHQEYWTKDHVEDPVLQYRNSPDDEWQVVPTVVDNNPY